MLIVETIARIRREHFIKGKTIKEIGPDLKVSRNTVRKVLRSGETSFEYERSIQPRPKLGRWAAELDELLAANAAKSAREQLTLIRIFEELRGAAMTAATMPYGVTPGVGARSAGNRPRRLMSR
ncbi:putative transcriptional regulator [Nitrobacter vulgaris]|nr:putative transcriptional regulator [Nitrobacter vulgaris]